MHSRQGARWRGQRLGAVLFDLDGTLLDTVADIALALNRTLAEYDCKPLAEDEVRRMVGRGSPILIERAAASQGRIIGASTQAEMMERFFHHYGGVRGREGDSGKPDGGPRRS